MSPSFRIGFFFGGISAFVVAAASACGSSGEPDASGTADGGPDGALGTGQGSSGSGQGTGTGTGTGVDTDGGGDNGGGGVREGGVDGGVTRDAGLGGTTTTLTCGSATCNIPAETCCVARAGGGGLAFACEATCATGRDTNAELKCSSGANCAAGTVCCANTGGDVVTSECKPTCGGGGRGNGDSVQLCDKSAATTGCPAGEQCSSQDMTDLGLPATFARCQGR